MSTAFLLLLSHLVAIVNSSEQGNWFDRWDGAARTVGGSSLLRNDPEDPRTTFRGSGSIQIEDGIMKMKSRPRLYVGNTDSNGWENVQVGGYAKVVNADGANKLTGLTVGARSNHGNYRNDGCDAFGYYARIYYGTGECAVQKEYYHDGSGAKVYSPSKRKVCFSEGRVPLNTWIGLKFIVETLAGDEESVLLGFHIDDGDGNGWKMAFNFTDSKDSWPAIGPASVLDQCQHKNGDPVLGKANDCFFRSDGSRETEVHWKDAHIITMPSRGRSRYQTYKGNESHGINMRAGNMKKFWP